MATSRSYKCMATKRIALVTSAVLPPSCGPLRISAGGFGYYPSNISRINYTWQIGRGSIRRIGITEPHTYSPLDRVWSGSIGISRGTAFWLSSNTSSWVHHYGAKGFGGGSSACGEIFTCHNAAQIDTGHAKILCPWQVRRWRDIRNIWNVQYPISGVLKRVSIAKEGLKIGRFSLMTGTSRWSLCFVPAKEPRDILKLE